MAAIQGVLANIRIVAAVNNCEYFNDASGEPSTVDGISNKGEWLGHTTGLGFWVKPRGGAPALFVQFYYETYPKFGQFGVQKHWKWVRASEAAPEEIRYANWLDQVQAPATTPGAAPTTPTTPDTGGTTPAPDVRVYPPAPDQAETDRLLAAFKRDYPSFPTPVVFKASDGKWYYRFDNGQTAEVAAWAKLTASQQASLSGGKDQGIGFTSSLASSGKISAASGQSSNLIAYIGVGLAVLVVGVLVFLNLKKRN